MVLSGERSPDVGVRDLSQAKRDNLRSRQADRNQQTVEQRSETPRSKPQSRERVSRLGFDERAGRSVPACLTNVVGVVGKSNCQSYFGPVGLRYFDKIAIGNEGRTEAQKEG